MTGDHSQLSPSDYERLCADLMDGIAGISGVETVAVEHDVVLKGKAMDHQIDVVWDYIADGDQRRRVFECKHWAKNVDNSLLAAWRTTVEDLVDPADGVFVTRTGYQIGAKKMAAYYGISIWTLRAPTESDWVGRLRDIGITMEFTPTSLHIEMVAMDWDAPPEVQGESVDLTWCAIRFPDDSYGTISEVLTDWARGQGLSASKEPDLREAELVFPMGTSIESPSDGSMVPIRSLSARVGILEGDPFTETIKIEGDKVVAWMACDIFNDEHFILQHNGRIRRVDAVPVREHDGGTNLE